MNFADRFSELVSNRGDVARLSQATGMSDSILSKYKRGITEPTLPQAVVIASYFDVSLDWLAGRDGYEMDSHKKPRDAASSPAEQKLVDQYRMMDPENRGKLEGIADALVMASEKNGPEHVDDVGGDRKVGYRAVIV